MKKYRIIIDSVTSHAYVNDLKCDWGNENNGIIPFDTLEELFEFANKHQIILKNKNEMQLKAEKSYIERAEKLEYYFFNKGIEAEAMWKARDLCFG